MTRYKGLLPRLFMDRMGGSGRPAWFVLLLAAMASAAAYVAVWAAIVVFVWSQGRMGYEPAVVVFCLAFLWAESTLWFHAVYLLRGRLGSTESAVGTKLEVWGGPVFMFALFLIKAMWLAIKYFAAPLIPFMLVIELRNVPVVGPAVCNALCVALLLYPAVCAVVYAVGRRGAGSRPMATREERADGR